METGTQPRVRGFTYFFHSDFTKQTKIGMAKYPENRFADLKNHVPGLRILRYVATHNPRWLESVLHETFADSRAQGEWFKLTPQDRKIIEALPNYVGNPEDLPLALRVRRVIAYTRSPNEDGHVPLLMSPKAALKMLLLENLVEETNLDQAIDAFLTARLSDAMESVPANLKKLIETALRSMD